VDWTKGGALEPPKIVVEKFDGANYEEAVENLKAVGCE